MTKTKYASLGQMVKNSDFTKLLEQLNEIEKDDRYMKTLLDKSGGTSELEGLLYYIPEFSLDESKALRGNVLECVDKIVELGADPNAIFKSGITPFMQACKYSTKGYVEHYYKLAKVNLELGDGRGAKPLFYAMMSENVEVMDYLVRDLGMNVNYKMILLSGKTVFHSACMELKEKSIFKLIELGARPDIYDDNGNYPCQLIPSFDDKIYEDAERDNEFYDKCDSLFVMLKDQLKEYKENKKIKKLTI